MRFFSKKKKNKQEKPPGKEQPDIFLGAASLKDLIAPSVIREVDPARGGGDYHVEIGSTMEPVRYFRSFYAALTSNSTYAGIMNSLYAGFGEADCDTAIHLIPLDPARTLWQLEQHIAQLETDYEEERNLARRKTILNRINDLARRHEMINKNSEKLFLTSIQTMASATDCEVFKRFCSLIVKKFGSKGIQLRAADTRQLQALWSMTPLDKEVIKEPFRDMESSNVADLFPFGLGGLRHKSGIILGHDMQGDLVFFDCWEPALGNYNMVIFGRSGFGKSFLVKFITERSSFLGILTAIIEPGDEFENLMVGMGCPYIGLNPGSKHRINIFDVDQEEDESGNVTVNLESTIKAVQAVVFRMIRSYEPNALTGQVKIMLQETIKGLYEELGINENPMSLYRTEMAKENIINVTDVKKNMPTLSDLYIRMNQKPELQAAAQFLKPFTRLGGNPAQAIFDCQSNVSIKEAPAFAISTKGLDDEIMKPIGLFVATKWVWEKFGKNWRLRKRIVVEEAQKMMDSSSPELAKWLEDAYRTARKKNISMCAVTQGFEVFLRMPQGLGILKNADTKVLMRQEALDIKAVQNKFSLSEGESSFVLNAPKGWGIIKVNSDTSIFCADATDYEYKMFTSDPNDLIAPGGGGVG